MRYALALALLAAIGCAGWPTRAADVTGTITNITADRVLVEEFPDRPVTGPGPAGNKGSFTVTPSTLLRDAGGTIRLADLGTGDRVRAWYRGPVLTSYPSQGEAEAIERY